MGLPLFISQILVSAIELSKDNSSARAQRAEILNLELGRLGSSATHKRTIMNSRLNQELRMIDCIRVPGNVNSIISLLNACCPTCDSSIALDVLHLVKLNGGATPNSIAHRK
ncbi:hypothetical protein V6N13_102878 [Hibiscus sabdariffa]